MEWIMQNKDWIFSGIGVMLLGGIWGLFRKRKHDRGLTQNIKTGDFSNNIQSGKEINLTIGGKRNEE